MNVSFIGLGKLGLPLACCLAKSGNKILGVDKNEYILEKLNNQELPFYEPGLSDIFPHVNFIGFTDSYSRAIEETEPQLFWLIRNLETVDILQNLLNLLLQIFL